MMTNCAPATALVALLLLLDSPDRVAHAQSSVNCPDPGSCYNTIGGGASKRETPVLLPPRRAPLPSKDGVCLADMLDCEACARDAVAAQCCRVLEPR